MPIKRSRPLAPVAAKVARRVRGRLKGVIPGRPLLRSNPLLLSHRRRTLLKSGDQDTGQPGKLRMQRKRETLSQTKAGENPADGMHETQESA